MATVTVDDPEMMIEKKVDGSGKVYISNQFAGKQLKIIVEAVEEMEESD